MTSRYPIQNVNRERLASVVIAVLAVLALAVGAAVIDTPTKTAGTGSGSGGGSGGLFGQGSTFDLGQSTQDDPTIGWFPKVIPQALVALLLIGFLVALYVNRDEIDRTALRNATAIAAVFGLLAVVWYFFINTFGASDSNGANGAMGQSTPAAPGGGTGGTAETALQPLSTNLPVVALVVGAVLVVGLAVVFRSSDDDEPPSDDDSEPTDTASMTGVGRAAGRAADRIESETTVENEVYRAWHEMTTQLEMQNPASSTPGEFAHAATDAGMRDRDVAELTDLFRTVRYGGSAITSEREGRAVAALRRIEETYTEES